MAIHLLILILFAPFLPSGQAAPVIADQQHQTQTAHTSATPHDNIFEYGKSGLPGSSNDQIETGLDLPSFFDDNLTKKSTIHRQILPASLLSCIIDATLPQVTAPSRLSLSSSESADRILLSSNRLRV